MQNSMTLATIPTAFDPTFVGTGDSTFAEDPSDETLMSRIAAGDRAAMGTLYARHRVRVYRFVLRLVDNAANAEDLTSEIFIDVWKQAHRFEGRSRASTWLLAIARHRALSMLRSRRTLQLDEDTAAEIPDDAENADELLHKQQRNATMRTCLARLSPAHREVIDLVYYHGKSLAEVAEITGAPENTVKTRMFHARKRLSCLLEAQAVAAG
jgi:RNA polymerase sigma-70 factor, ECF subfamily